MVTPCETIPLTSAEAEQMAMDIIDVLDQNPEAEYSQDQLLIAAGYDPTKYRIPRRVRTMFQNALARTGLFVPPSVPSLGFAIFSTKNPEKLFEPLLHIAQIGHGVDKLTLRITDYIVNSAAGKEWGAKNPQTYSIIRLVHRSVTRQVEDKNDMTMQVADLIAAR